MYKIEKQKRNRNKTQVTKHKQYRYNVQGNWTGNRIRNRFKVSRCRIQVRVTGTCNKNTYR